MTKSYLEEYDPGPGTNFLKFSAIDDLLPLPNFTEGMHVLGGSRGGLYYPGPGIQCFIFSSRALCLIPILSNY